MKGHFDADDAAIYALGALDELAREAMDRHAAGCASCSRLLGSAEDDVARMALAQSRTIARAGLLPTRIAPTRAGWQAWTALAAAVVLAILPAGYFWQQNRAMHATLATHAEVMSRLADAHVRSAAFTSLSGGASARVMYAPDGSWYVVLVRGATVAFEVAWMHEGRQTLLGTARPSGDVAMLYLPKSHRMDQLALVEGRRVVAEAQLAYESK
jgi:hypothetical protein